MGSSMGCVRPPREGGHGFPPLSPNPKRRLRFRRKRKGKKHQKGGSSVGSEVESIRISNIPEEEDEEEEDKGTVTEATTASFKTMSDVGAKITNLTVPQAQTQSRLPSALCADSTSDSMGGLGGSRVLELSPEPSPVWRRLSYPGAGSEEEGTSSTMDASSSQGQPSENLTPDNPDNSDPAVPSQVHTTPGGGQVCKVREREQGVLERPSILRPKKEREREKEEKGVEDEGGGGVAGTLGVAFNTPPEKERKGVVHIREVGGLLCVVRTVYPSDFGCPVWTGDGNHDNEVEVRAEPPAASPVTGNILKVQLSEEDIARAKIDATCLNKTANRPGTRETTKVKEGTVTGNKVQLSEEDSGRAKMDARTAFLMETQETTEVKELSLDKPAQVQEGLLIQNPFASGYASDLLPTSPETGGATQVGRVGLTQRRDNMDTSGPNMTTNLPGTQGTTEVEGPSVQDPLSSGYASDLPLTSPEAGGATQGDWESSREGLDSATDSPLSPPQVTTKQFPQISEIYVSGESGDLTAKEKLLLWSQQATEGWPGLRCTNFSSSWSDGRMFNALLHRFRPDLIDMEVVAQQSNLDNLEQAFEIAESLGVTRLLDAEDVDVSSPDEKSVITYVSSIYDAFPKIPEGGEGIAAHEVDQRWAEYRSRFSTLIQWSRQHKALMANKTFPLDPVELKELYNEYVHFKETEIPAKELEKSRVEHLYKLLEVWMEFGRIKLPLGLHPNDLEEEWGKLILEMLEREKALRPAVERLELLLQMANKIQNMALDCEEKLTLAKNTLQADMSLVESGEAVRCERELGLYLQDCEVLIRQLNLDLNILRDEKYYQVEQLAFRASCLHEELVSLRLQCSSVYRKGHFSPVTGGDRTAPRGSDSGLSLSTGAQTLLGAVGVVGAIGAALLRRPMSRSQLVAMSSSEDEGSLRFIYELLGWVEETRDVLERAEWGADLPSVEQNLQDHQNIHTAVEELLHSLKEARNYETKVSPNFRSSYSDTLAKLEHLYCKLLELSSWRLRCLESLHAFVCRCTEELIWLNEREEEELAYDWSQNNTNVNAKRELYAEMRSELEEKQEVMHSLQETADRLCQENHPAKQTVEAYSAALLTQWQWVRQLCVCVEQHLKDNTTYFQFVSDARDCETYLRQLQDTIKRQYTCDKSSRLSKLEDLLQDSMEEKEQLIEYRSSVASLVGRAKTVVQLRPRSAESTLGSTTPIRAICDYRQIEITISRGEECVLADNSQRTKWKVISPSGNEAMVPSVCFTVPPPNQEAMDTASRMEQLYQNVMSLWHNLHVSMKSVVSWHYLQKDIRTVSSWSLDTVRSQTPVARDQALDHLEAHLADFLSDSKESALFTPTERRELERDAHTAQEHCQDLLVNMETVEKDESVSRSYLSELQNIKLRLEEAEQRLMRGIQTPPPSNRSGDSVDNTVQIAEQEKLQSDLEGLRTSLGEVSRRCVRFFEEKPTSSSVPVLRSELNLAVEKIDRLHNLSSVYLHKLKTVDVLMYSLQAAESQVKRYESRLSEEDIVPAGTNAIQALREQLGTWQSELEDQEGVFSSLQSAVQKAREAGTQLNRLHPDRSPELERYQERATQLTERWAGVKRQMDTRRGELEALGSVLQQYRDGHSALIHWIEETTERQENTQPGKTDSKVLSEQLAQQTALVADIEKNQTKLDECQTHSKQYCTSVKDYELQLMTFRAFVESAQKSTGKRRRMHSSSDAITQEFMDLRTRYTALVTLTTQHVKYISDALRRLEEEEKEVEEERQQRVGQVSELLGWVKGLQGRAGDPSAESSIAAQEAVSEQLAAKKEEVAKVIRNTQVFLMSKQASKLSPEERAQVTSQLDELTATYSQLCDSSTAQLQQLVQQQAKEEQRKVVQQEKAECSQKLEGLTMWLAGAASMLANQRAGAESGDVNVLQQKQRELKEVQKDLLTRGEGVAETIRSVEEFLAEHGDSLSPEERANLQGALSRMKEHYSALTDTAQSSLAQLDTAISTTVQQNTQRAKAVEELQETRGQIDSLLEELSSLDQPGVTVTDHLSSSSSTSPEGGLQSHSDMLQAELQQLQAQQAQLMQVSQNARSLLDQPDSAVSAEEKRRLRDQLDQLQTQHQEKLRACQERLRRSEALKDDLAKFLQEHGGLGTWLEQSEGELCSLGEGETDAQGLKGRLEEHKKLAEDVICHKADLRFVSISGQKVLDSVQGALEKVGGSDPALEETKQLVTGKLQDANHRYTALHTKSSDLGGRLSGLLERYQQYQDEAVSLHTWLSAQEQNQSIAGPSGETDTQTLQNTLRAVQLLQDELAERSVQLEKVRRSGRELANTRESPTLRAAEITSTADGLEKRFCSLSESVSERAEQLQTSVAQSVSVQEGLKGLLAWLDGLLLTPGPIQPTAQAVQDALTQNQKLRQELLSRQGSVEATCDSVSKLLQSSDASTASGLQASLESLTQSYGAAQAKQAEREAELRGLLPKLENYERLSTDLQGFTQTCLRALSPAGQPDRSMEDYRQTIEEVRAEQEQEAGQLKSFCQLGTDLSQAKALTSTQTLLDNVREVSDEFARLETNINERYNAIQSCEQQLGQFRSLSGSLLRWLQTTQEQLPLKEPNINTEALQRRVQQLKDLLSDWEAQGVRVLELNKTGSELETLIINITAPQTKTGVPQVNGAGSPSSVNGIHTCKDLTELQVAVAEVNGRYEELGEELKDRQWRQETSLELRQKARQSTEELSRWLGDRENSLHLGQTAASPSKPEVVRAQAQENKALLSELAEHSGKVKELKSTLEKLIADNPDSPEVDTWRQQMKEIDSRWAKANEAAVQRQVELETCADRLGSFATAASQLGPWLKEKELMMSVLGPLSIDPNMLNTQNQQVQFMLREFETRRPQFDQLTQAAEGILSPSGGDASPQDAKDLAEVRSELGSISQQWDDLTQRLSRRSEHIDQAQGTSERYQALLKNLSVNVGALGERLDSQASLSAQPEALKRRLQETGEIRSELEQRREELGEAEKLCGELSAIVVEPYLRDELKKRLESVSGPLRSLEERAADGLSQLQAALSSTQQFQQMFEELRSWLDNQSGQRDSTADSLPYQPEAIRTLLAQQDELHRGVASQRGPYELIQAEGASLLASLPAGGEERSALLSRLTALRQDWDDLNQCITERQNRMKSALTKAESYQQHRAELTPWVAECEEREADIQLSLDPAALDEALQKSRQLCLNLDRRRPLLEALNIAADQLLEHCHVGEEDVRDEKAQLNRRVDGLGENLQNRVSQLEELAGRLKEFEDGRQAVERRLEAARHQIEVQEALGPQACSNKSLERLRSQQETLHSLQPQVAYLRDLAQGLVQDAPHTAEGGGEGGQRLEQQARDTDREFGDVSEKIEKCCSTLESRLQGVGEVQSSVRDLFSHLADLDDELDSLSPVGRDADSLASQADAVQAFLARLATLRSELEGHGGDCTAMLRREGSSPDLLALRRETEALSRQAGKLSERGQARMGQIEVAAEKVGEFYAKVAELQGLLGRAEEGLNAQGVVGTEVENIKQQLHEFKAVEREQVDSIQPKLQRVNAVGQGLIQSAAKHTDTQALEHDLETTNLRWNSLNKRVAERIAQLQEALLHCGKFQDALEPLLSWLSDTEELVANQKPPSAEYRVVKAQIQEQKLLQRLLDDRRATFQMIQGEGERIAATAETQDRDKIQKQLESLGERWGELLEKARARQCQLEELQTLALQFHEAVEPLGEWLSATERRLSTAEPMGTQTSKITQQITKHKAVQEAVSSRGAEVDRLQALGQSLAPLSCAADRDWLGERVGAVRLVHSELSDWCQRRAVMLEQALANAQLFGEDEVEVLNWLAEVGQRLGQVSVQSYQPGVLTQQHKHTLSLNEEIVSRKKQVDQAIKNGQALLKQTTGEEVLLIQEKLDGIKSRYAEMTGGSSKALRTLEQALQLSTRFASAHDDLNQWLDKVEAELNIMEPDATPTYQDRQKELKCVSAEKRLVLDTVNEVGNALLDLVPWRAREGLDRLVADANQRYRTAAETITQRVKLVQAAIQRSQQYEEAVDAELTWAGETERKLSSLGPLSLEPDVTVAQLQVQRAFNIDIIRHKDTVDQLIHTRDDILETCSDQQRDALVEKTDSLSARYEAVSQQHQERFSALEQAQVLVARFWETQEDLEPWLGETETLIAQLPPPAIDTEALRLQQEQMRLLRESIAEHKPHIDKLLKIGPQLAALSHQEGATVRQRYSDAEKRYVAIKEVVKGRATTLDEAVSQSAQFHDKMDPLLETLEGAVQRLRSPPPVAAEADKIREQLADHKATGLELDKLLPSFSALCARGEELISRAAHDDPAAQAVRSRLLRLRSLWDEIRQRAEEREGKLTDVLDLAGKFWADMAALLSTLRDSQDIVKELEDPGVDPSLIKQQIEAAEAIKAETDGLREELEFVRTLGADLIFACGETEKPEVKKTIDEMNVAWEGLNRTWRERMERLEEAMTASVQYQDALQSMFDYLDNAVIKLCDMSTVGTDLGTVKQQIEELKQYKVEVYQQQIDMEKLCHQGELLLKKVSDQTDRDMIQEPLTELRHLWDNLGDKITHRQHKLEGALLALGQFQHALSELQSWLSHTHATLDTQRPINSDPKAIEIELAKHHVLRNDVLSHRSTVETVNAAGAELLESSPGDEANHLRGQLDHLNRGWENLLLKTQDRQKLLEAALHQAEGFHGELEEFLQWLRRTESQLSAAKPTGGLPETAREQLQQHLELQTQLAQRAEQYNRLLDAGESMLLSRGGEEGGPGAGTTQTQQNLALLQNKWASLNTKMDDRRAKLDEAVSLATGFQSSLQDTINWLTQAEQTLNMAQPPSLILDTVLFQIDEHKVFVNEVNTHREQVLALEKAGSQLRFASVKQDVVLIKNLLLSVQARWDKLVQRSLDRGRHLDEARKRAKQFHEAWRKLSDWLEEAESRLDSELEISNEPDKIKVHLTKHKEFQKALGSKQPVYDTTVRSGKAMRDKATLPEDTQKLDHLLGEVRDNWDTVCGKSVERQHKLEEALLFSGQFAEALQALVDWLYRVEPQLAEDLPVHGDLDLVSNLMDSHKAFQKELGKRTTSVHALKRSARELMETGRDDTAWVKVQLQELSNRWDTVCALSVTKQTRLQQALKQAEEFRTAVQLLLEWLSEAEQTLRFRGVLPEEAETLQTLLHTHRNFMATVEEKRTDVNRAAGQGEAILTACQADCITTIKHWITIIRARFEEVLTWAKQHEQRLETALTELLNNATLLEELLSWLQWAETTLVQRDRETLPQDIPQIKTLITEHQVFMEEMTRKQPDVDKVTKTYKRKPAEPPSSLAERRGARKNQQQQQHQQAAMQVAGGNTRLTQLCSRWQQVWLLALDRQRKLNDALDRLEELKEFASFDFDVWRKKYMRWMNHKKSRVMDFFRRIDKDQDGKITRQEFIDGILASKFPTSRLEMTAVADIFDQDGDGYIDYYEFVAALHPNKDAYRPTTDADKIEDEVTRQVAQCKCAKRFQVEQIGENKYRMGQSNYKFFLGNQFGDSQQLRLVRILRSTVMVRVGGGWMALDEFLVKNDPCRVQHPGLKILRSDSSSTISSRIVTVTPGYFCCRARGRTNLELREKFILPEGASQGLAAFRSRGRRSKPGSRTASPTRSSSSASHSAHSCASLPSTPATPTASSRSSNSRGYAKPWLAHSKTPTPTKCQSCPDHDHTTPGHEGAVSGSKLKRPTFHSSRGSLTGENGGATPTSTKSGRTDPRRTPSGASGAASRAGSRAGSRASSRRGSDASDASELLETRSACSDTSDTPRRPGAAKPSKIPTISKKTPSPKTPASGKK
ncbi:microtubule-actin cross-linking factor 1-like isoform X17 [Salvelinus fontinalis]|uniref:microtubule-actin cross-linking factor 1-like isoform X17 n=1 Tax=Salvelinus fontinalis TaxID=8038 RepID=UPI002486AD03|nr:microtubule-actin cross-linking factor 1-like isoform X17 [Salvelinus fontinalis]